MGIFYVALGLPRASARGLEVRQCDPSPAIGLKGKRRAKTDRLDARWMALLLAKQMLPDAGWRRRTSSPCAISRGCVRRCVTTIRGCPTGCTPCSLTTATRVRGPSSCRARGRRWAEELSLDTHVRARVKVHLRMLATIEDEIALIERDLRTGRARGHLLRRSRAPR